MTRELRRIRCCVSVLVLAACGGDGQESPFGALGSGAETGGSEGAGDSAVGTGGSGANGGGESGESSGGPAPCGAASDCDDGVACTVDHCDPALGCRHVPDDAACGGNLCTGAAVCDPDLGCQSGTPVDCNDDEACTQDTCDPASGTCNNVSIAACIGGDGCCPAGCGPDVDDDCECVNFAPSAMPLQSDGGGSGAYGPAAWIDGVEEHDCVPGCDACYGWVDNPEGSQGLTEYMQLEWDDAQTIGSIYVATSDAVLTPCATPGYPRNIDRGEVQYWDGLEWVVAQPFSGEQDDLFFEFDPPLQTTAIRVDGVRATASANPQIAPPGSSIVFEWYVYEPPGCFPDLPPD